jgi:F-type H+-transporting ATPase subunit delta
MQQNLAKRYVKALKMISDELVLEAYEVFKILETAYKNDDFKDIILSTGIDKNQKIELIRELIKTKNSKISNFLELLNQNSRLELIPNLYEELRATSAVINNKYEGIISSKEEISQEIVAEFSSKLSSKLSKDIEFKQNKIEDENVKVSVEDLDIEVSFSKELFKTQMREHILKAI